jgi:hypothetical protein
MKRCRSLVAPLLLAISMSSFTVGTVAVAQIPGPTPITIIIVAVTSCLASTLDPVTPCDGVCYFGGDCIAQLFVGPLGNISFVCQCL